MSLRVPVTDDIHNTTLHMQLTATALLLCTCHSSRTAPSMRVHQACVELSLNMTTGSNEASRKRACCASADIVNGVTPDEAP